MHICTYVRNMIASLRKGSSIKRDSTSCTSIWYIQSINTSLYDIQVYRFYRDLISFQGLGEPSLMLRCINPREVSECVLLLHNTCIKSQHTDIQLECIHDE